MKKSKLIIINKDTKAIKAIQSNIAPAIDYYSNGLGKYQNLGLAPLHDSEAIRTGNETLYFSFEVNKSPQPDLKVDEFCLVVREKIDLSAMNYLESLIRNDGENKGSPSRSAKRPNVPVKESFIFTELKGKNG